MVNPESARTSSPSWGRKVLHALGVGDKEPIDKGLSHINQSLGLHGHRTSWEPRKPASIRVEATQDRARSIFFAPDIDGQADSGEVVWVWAPTGGPQSPPTERAVLVVGRTRTTVLGLLISPNPEHAEDDCWLEIGSGEWDESGRQCWIRLDRLLEISEEQVRRQGILFPQRRFERIANRLRAVYHWA
ncbi:type II toxin-antitoxin system PemK/MazF family toxin [Corynebacterium confusum]|uniref:type II toxin-antitoxin system PemK/MazF family toxin n=1 Tax=uncultured Corynebacterium sp. TaxID=159447 RepID=UPI0025CDDDD1|nr:type II toxin-antitoxin system PemK/MazF family toxin [uncultured Corynebacterium sp.]